MIFISTLPVRKLKHRLYHMAKVSQLRVSDPGLNKSGLAAEAPDFIITLVGSPMGYHI